jgi:hypothetical protein
MIGVLFGGVTRFHFAGREKLGERDTLRWDFTLAKEDNEWVVSVGQRSAKVNWTGSLWADAETELLLRLQTQAMQFPARFPVKAAARSIDYARVRIGPRDVLLPVAADDRVQEAGGAWNINRSRFGQCREYSASSEITFDTPSAQTAPVQPKAALTALPPNVQIRLALDDHVRSTGVVIGAPLRAHVLSDIRHAGTLLVPQGTQVRGVLRQMTKTGNSFVVRIEFIDLVLSQGNVPFRAQLRSFDIPISGLQWLIPGEADLMRPMHYGSKITLDDAHRPQQVKLDPVPGVAVLIIAGDRFDIPPGTPMTWVTGDDKTKH